MPATAAVQNSPHRLSVAPKITTATTAAMAIVHAIARVGAFTSAPGGRGAGGHRVERCAQQQPREVEQRADRGGDRGHGGGEPAGERDQLGHHLRDARRGAAARGAAVRGAAVAWSPRSVARLAAAARGRRQAVLLMGGAADGGGWPCAALVCVLCSRSASVSCLPAGVRLGGALDQVLLRRAARCLQVRGELGFEVADQLVGGRACRRARRGSKKPLGGVGVQCSSVLAVLARSSIVGSISRVRAGVRSRAVQRRRRGVRARAGIARLCRRGRRRRRSRRARRRSRRDGAGRRRSRRAARRPGARRRRAAAARCRVLRVTRRAARRRAALPCSSRYAGAFGVLGPLTVGEQLPRGGPATVR